jgi:tRNA A37 threonylcarbamoyladenosine synthetase subunit TsaC/SUA5/YrdC
MTAQAETQVIEAREGAITPGATAVARAARTLAAGSLVAFPTETVYGLGADATNGAAAAAVSRASGAGHAATSRKHQMRCRALTSLSTNR